MNSILPIQSHEIIQDPHRCDECGSSLIHASSGFTCSKCGLVNFQMFDDPLLKISERDEEETGAFSYYGERSHIVDGMGSFISYYGVKTLRDARGKRLSRSNEQKFLRLKRINDLQLHTMNRESDYRALMVLNRMTSSFQLTKQIRGRAAYLLRVMTPFVDKSPGLNRIILVATALYISMRESPKGNPITLTELAEGFKKQGHRISKKLIIRALWTLRPKLSRTLDFTKILSKSQDYIATVLHKLQATEKIKNRIIARKIDEQKYYQLLFKVTRDLLLRIPYQVRGGRNPFIFTVSAVYAADHIVSKRKLNIRPVLSQKVIAEAANVAEYSVRDHFARVISKYIDMDPCSQKTK
ncbi:MAG: hypothetical protein ACFFDT_33255 [Candidatus Hodarchaeota archaeon]